MGWSPVRRVAFRFGFLVAALLVLPFPLGAIPKTDWLVPALRKPLEWLTSWFATGVLGLDAPSSQQTDSGDTTAAYVQHLVIGILAVVGAAAWSALDRRRTAYPRLAAAAIAWLRYYLAFTMLVYAFAKLTQFPTPTAIRLDQRVGDLSPMGMLWTFMGSSRPYAVFGGCAEALGGVLLLWRRTYVAGALVTIAAMSNVVALNLCYDVPVKLFSTQLLVIAIVLFAPHARRLICAVLGRAAAEVPQRPRRSLRLERVRLVARSTLIALMALDLYAMVDRVLEMVPPKHELQGIWDADRFVLDGAERPPLLTDGERWHKVYLSGITVGVRLMGDGSVVRFPAKVDPAQRAIRLRRKDGEAVWTYALSTDGDRASLVLDGVFRGKLFHAELHREPDPVLVTRGFHWINELPFVP